MRSSKKAITASLCSGLVVLIVVAIVFADFRRGTQAAQPGGSVDMSATAITASDQARVAQNQRNFAEVGALLKRIADAPEPSIFSAEKTADEIGKDPAALFAYVHDHVRTQIYSGVLRGARGTLISGAGNSWDKALLLATMLRHQGKEARFARVHFTPEMAAKTVDRMFSDAARPHMPAGKPLQIPDSLQNQSRAMLAQVHADWQAAQTDLLQALDRANLPLGNAATSEQQLEAEAADHLFVEYREGDRWIALDPIMEDTPGASVSSAAEYAPEIPDSFYHHVTIHVSIEERHGPTLQQREVLRFSTTAAALSPAQVLLSHKFELDVAGGWRATPVLQIDGQAYAALTFSDAGLSAAKVKEDRINQAQQAISQAGQAAALFGGNQKPAATPAAAPQGAFSAEWLDVDFTDPAKHSDVVRRELIDRIGPVARANKTAVIAPLTSINVAHGVPLELEGVYALAFATAPLNPALLGRRLSAAAGIIGDLQALRDARPVQNGSLSPEDQQRLVRILDQYPALLQVSAESTLALSQHFARGLHVGDSPVLFYESTPRLAIASFDLRSGLALDLRRNKLRVFARRSSGSDLVRANLVRSIGDAAIEGDVLMPEAHARRIAGIDIFDRARTQGVRLVAIRAGAPLTTLQASDLVRARMASAEAGTLLVAPERTPSAKSHFAWWKLDPSTGEAIITLDTGLNGFQDLPEEAVLESSVISPMAQTLTTPYLEMLPLATTLSEGGEISPLAYDAPSPFSAYSETDLGPVIGRMPGQVAPWAKCRIWSEDMLLEALRVLTAAGEDTSEFGMEIP